MSIGNNNSKWPKPEQVDPQDGETIDRRTQELASEVITQISPKPHKESPGRDEDQAPGSEAIHLINDARSMRAEDTNRPSKSQEGQQPVFPTLDTTTPPVSEPLSKHTVVVDQSLPLPANLLDTYQKQRGSNSQTVGSLTTSDNASKDAEEGESQFEILAVRDCPSSSSSDSSQECTDDSTSSKHPQQVADSQGRSLRLSDLLKGQLQFNHPAPIGQESKGTIKVSAGNFPPYEALNNAAGLIIFSTKRNLPAGEISYRLTPDLHGYLGHGGYGHVFQLYIRGEVYAAKMTRYRENELNIWSKLDHPNVIPLLGVIMGKCALDCYQLMPLMNGSLRSMMCGHGDVYSHLVKDRGQWRVVLYNTLFVFKEILEGLSYLAALNIQHSDLKADNILVKKSCFCKDLLHCDCPSVNKYIVQIADFDSVKQTMDPRKASQLTACKEKLTNMKSVHGTLEYRAPEQFKLCPELEEFRRVLQDGRALYNAEGPWCDMWSMGVIMLWLVTRSQKDAKTFIDEANIVSHYNASTMEPHIESNVATLRLQHLLKLQLKNSELRPLAEVVCKCLEIDPTKRATASQLLNAFPPVCEARLNKCT